MSDLSTWPALILAAGYGTRLRPLSYQRAKPSLPVNGVPLVVRILRRLAASGVRDVVVNLHYRPETITRLVGNGSQFGLRVRYSWEGDILGSAGGPARALQLDEAERWLVVNGDTLSDVDLASLATRHLSSKALVTMAVIPNPAPVRYGGVLIEDDDEVTDFRPSTGSERPELVEGRPADRNPAGTFHFVGAQAVDRAAFEGVPTDRRSESVGELYPRLMKARPGSVRAYVSRARFFDIGSPAEYLQTSLGLAREEGAGHAAHGFSRRIGRASKVIDCVLWDGVDIGARAELFRCIVGNDVRIPRGSRFHECVVVPACDVPREFDCERVGDLAVAGLEPGRPGSWELAS